MITKYDIKNEVDVLKLTDVSGIIKRISIGDSGIQYDVRYFDGVEMKNVWFYEDEIILSKN